MLYHRLLSVHLRSAMARSHHNDVNFLCNYWQSGSLSMPDTKIIKEYNLLYRKRGMILYIKDWSQSLCLSHFIGHEISGWTNVPHHLR